ncbi:DUF11 domain-containing protein [Nocardioides sp. SYSU D00065]|uniref:DUF7927 domain-containing protein n=1 Tax=Nocardioides sp. SYSU D00065 TaxID=2817378 RepID=UPI001B34031B|nr:DUF11 domain-containing protein [Nocardioides sp. SYSU D00065]
MNTRARRPRADGLPPGRSRLARLARQPFLFLLALVVALGTLAAGASPASAAPTYEFVAEWEAGTPGQPGVADPDAAKGDVVTGLFRISVNSDLEAPTNEPVDNVFATVTLANGSFGEIPDVCFTGAAYTPRSSISADKRTLTCNIGTVHEGTAALLQVPIVADGPTGSAITATADAMGVPASLPPVPIRNTFGMNMHWGTPTGATIVKSDPDAIGFDFEWTLFQDQGSDEGPQTVTYDLSIPLANGMNLELSELNQQWNTPCTPHVTGIAGGHPFSSPNPSTDPRFAPFVETCTLTKLPGYNNFRMTISGIDYSQTQVPTTDSAGDPMPTDRVAIAAGSIWLEVRGLTAATSARLDATEPTYQSITGQTDVDDPSDNISTKTINFPGTWSQTWARTNGGTAWDYSFKLPPESSVVSQTVDLMAAQANVAGSTVVAACTLLDNAYVDYDSVSLNIWENEQPQAPGALPAGAYYEWYVGNDPLLTPGATYNPDESEACGAATGWTRTEPADKTLVKGVRVTGTAEQWGYRNINLRVAQVIEADAPTGQHIWTFGTIFRNGAWNYDYLHGDVPIGQGGRTEVTEPGGRYETTTPARDVLRVVYAVPAVTKRADRAQVRPGVPATFTLVYSANGAGSVPPTVDDYTIVDVLPVGMTYVTGSATPAPTTITTNAQGQQVLTWSLDEVPTNVRNTLTYQAVVGPNVTPGVTLTNTVSTSLRGETSRPATAQVTTSTNGYTQISKVTDTPFIPNVDGSGDGAGSWTVNLRSFDPLPNSFTDVIDILPYEGDGRGTDFDGTYDLSRPVEILGAAAGTTVYYTTADPATLQDDPRNPTNGNAAGTTTGNTVGWTTTYTPAATAVRVIGPRLDPGALRQFRVHIVTDGASPADVYVNRADGNAGHTRLAMRTSAPMQMAPHYSANLKKYVQDVDGNWHDAQDVTDYPAFRYGDTVRYRVVVTNTGQGTLNDIVLEDDKQPELGAFTIDSLAPGQSQSHEYSFVLDEDQSGTVVNTACAEADVPADSGSTVPPAINCDPAGIEITNYKTVKTSVPAELTTVKPGDKVTYTVRVTQQGTAPANAVFTDDLSDVFDDATYNGDVTSSIGEATLTGNRLAWAGTIPVGQVATVTYSVTVKPIANLKANGDFGLDNVVSSPGCDPKAGEDADCKTRHDVGVYEYSKTSDPKSTSKVSIGDEVTYTVRVKQVGKAAVPGATLTDDLSAVLDDATYNGDAAASSGSVSVSGSTLSWTGDLAVGASATITYSVTVRANGDNRLRNVVTSNDPRSVCVPAPDQNADCTTTHIKTEFDLKLKKSIVSGPRATVGDNVRYRLDVTNRGPGVAPAPIKLSDKLPAGLELVSASGKGWDCTVKKATDRVVCEMDTNLKAGQKAKPVFVVAKTTAAAAGKKLVNVAEVKAAGDTVKANNEDKAKVKVAGRPEVLPNTGFRPGFRAGWV